MVMMRRMAYRHGTKDARRPKNRQAQIANGDAYGQRPFCHLQLSLNNDPNNLTTPFSGERY